ncbi:IS1182 family transposase [Kitasatospora xanthocidica]|uniref:IS1182 family transposase n=1 Tax=Kitasatospora xanthocidica TaxID=83382 RepID=UPI0036E32464
MSLRPVEPGEVPEETARVAHAVFPHGCLAVRLRDEVGSLFSDEDFADLFSRRGRPAASPARLALVSVLQFAEGLSDRQAAHAVRSRIDWKYALGLELTDVGFDFSVLSEFRDRLIAGGAEARVLDAVLDRAAAHGLLKAGGRQRSDATHVLAAVRDLNRFEFVVETLRAALNALAVAAPQRLAEWTPPEWFERYSARPDDTKSKMPGRWAARVEHGNQVGQDGMDLLRAVRSSAAPDWLRHLPAVEFLRQTWVQEYELVEGEVTWRKPSNRPTAAQRPGSPYDPDARVGVKRDRVWSGYKVHLTETCEPTAPHLITSVVTTPASVDDSTQTEVIHQKLSGRGLLPDVHLVDSGYATAANMVAARRNHGVELCGPVRPNTGWQATSKNGYSIDAFTVDWDRQQATCPNGAISRQWYDDHRGKVPVIRVKFSPTDCRPCPTRSQCTRTIPSIGREITLRTRPEHEAIRQARINQEDEAWQRRYGHRAGVEGTISQASRAFGLRRSRYRGHAKTQLQHLLTAAGINLVRLDAWLTDTALAPTRTSHFAALRPTG